MGTEDAEVVEKLSYSCSFKVHRLMCVELMKLIDNISRIFPEIEEARPRCSSGIQALCMLNSALDKAKQLLQYCSDSSKLYLAITGEVIVSRCQRTKSLLEQSLCRIQSMVPIMLAVEISQAIDDLRAANFILDSSEEEAGKMVRELLQQGSASESRESSEIRAIQFAATKLHITSPKALLIEKRSIKKQLDTVGQNDCSKKKILKYLMYLLKKYGKFIMKDQADTQCEEPQGVEKSRNSSVCCQPVEVHHPVAGNRRFEHPVDMSGPPEEFKCPISMRLMFDPVVIASGQTYERLWIRKWFDEGNVTCPKTKMRLTHLSLTPNTAMKDLISKWCLKHGVSIPDPSIQSDALQSWDISSTSIASFGSSMNDVHLQFDFSSVSLGSLDTSYNSDSSRAKIINGSRLMSMHTDGVPHSYRSNIDVQDAKLKTLLKLHELDWESQCKAVEDVRNQLKVNDQDHPSMSSQNFIEPLIKFLSDSQDKHDVKAQRAGCQLLLALVRNGTQYLSEDAFSLLQNLLDSEVAEEALAVIEFLSSQRNCVSKIAASGALASILKLLDSQIKSSREPAVKVLCNLSSNRDICTQMASLECIQKLVPLLGDETLGGYCVKTIKNLFDINKARASLTETNGGIASIASLLESDSREDQEHAVSILLSLCSEHDRYCHTVMEEGVIPALVHISINGSDRGMVFANELLRLLRDMQCDTEQEYIEPDLDATSDHFKENKSSVDHNQLKEKKSSSKSSGFFGRKLSVFSKKK